MKPKRLVSPSKCEGGFTSADLQKIQRLSVPHIDVEFLGDKKRKTISLPSDCLNDEDCPRNTFEGLKEGDVIPVRWEERYFEAKILKVNVQGSNVEVSENVTTPAKRMRKKLVRTVDVVEETGTIHPPKKLKKKAQQSPSAKERNLVSIAEKLMVTELACSASQDHAMTTPACSASQDHTMTTPASSSSQDREMTTPACNASQDHTMTTPACSASQDHTMTTPASSSSQDREMTTPACSASQDHTMTTPASSSSQDREMTTPACSASQDHKMTTPACSASQDHKMTTPACSASQRHEITSPACSASQDHKMTTPACSVSQDHKMTTPACSASQDHEMTTSACSASQYTPSTSTRPLPQMPFQTMQMQSWNYNSLPPYATLKPQSSDFSSIVGSGLRAVNDVSYNDGYNSGFYPQCSSNQMYTCTSPNSSINGVGVCARCVQLEFELESLISSIQENINETLKTVRHQEQSSSLYLDCNEHSNKPNSSLYLNRDEHSNKNKLTSSSLYLDRNEHSNKPNSSLYLNRDEHSNKNKLTVTSTSPMQVPKDTVYNGKTKEQLRSIREKSKDYSKAAKALLFALYTPGELEGHSVNGKGPNGASGRPALEDTTRLIVIYELMEEKWPFATRSQINKKLGEVLKPSAGKKGK